MILKLSNLLTTVECTDEEFDWIFDYLSFESKFFRPTKGQYTIERIRLFNRSAMTFPTGFVSMVEKTAAAKGFPIVKEDKRVKPIARDPNADLSWLRDYQLEAAKIASQRTRGILWIPTGGGKCLGIGTRVIKYDGSLVAVEDLRVGDMLMGPDSCGRTVQSVTRGAGPLFRIDPRNSNPLSWVCNDAHVLTLIGAKGPMRKIIDTPLTKFMKLKSGHDYYKLFSVDVSFDPPTGSGFPKIAPVIVNKNYNFSITPIGEGEYAGFTLDGDGRFLLEDLTVTHNTEVGIAMALAYPCPWVFIVHRATLLQQAAERWEKRSGEPAGCIGDKVFKIHRFNVATFQTLLSLVKQRRTNPKDIKVQMFSDLVNTTGGMIVDESHVLPARNYSLVAMRFKNAYWRIGLSGTPLSRGDRRSLMAIGTLGPVIYRLMPNTLIKQGVLARPDIRIVDTFGTSTSDRYTSIYGSTVIRNTERNELITEIAKIADKPSLVFVKSLKHGKHLLDRFKRVGLNAEFIWGAALSVKRRAAVERLVRAEIDVLITSVIFQEGVDIPELRSVVIATAGKSVIAAIQRIGRGMRMSAGKNGVFQVWDFYDYGHRVMENHSAGRIKAYKKEGYEVLRIKTLDQLQLNLGSQSR